MKFAMRINNGERDYIDLTIQEAIDQALLYWSIDGDAPVELMDEQTGALITKFRIEGYPRELTFEQLCELSYYKSINLVSCS